MDQRDATISRLKRDLEVSHLFNRGVLSSNQEQKDRIVELEAENAILRTTESKLAALEEAFEEQEKRTQRAENVLADARRRAASCLKSLKNAEEGRELAERDAAYWRGRSECLAEAAAQAQSIFEDAMAAVAAPPKRTTERFTLALPGVAQAQTAPPALAVERARASTSESSRPVMHRRKRLRTTDDEDNGSVKASPPTARRLFTNMGNGKTKESRLATESGEEDSPYSSPPGVTGKKRGEIPDSEYLPAKGKGVATSTDPPPVTRRKGRHSSPLPRRATVPKARAPATAPRIRRPQPPPEPTPESDIAIKSEPESDSDPLDRWDD
ncbi:hypothetical protein CcaverHIS002_0702620 [Cutaneotrichosporon cavernicola]|nr:hypothetical protein CcaverHIS002_0702620 [Cutaneotrichosporon cavernicola]BEJ02464.1 hypothetical protein CcaverHIS631_0702590 [Cutaneotrichosporon cavernicola]BEJ10223.1 hypothetical protein CcaverHIS641_0702580 [Cutaneotrichosporon cavernicola]